MKKQEISFCDMFCGNQIKTLEEGKDDLLFFGQMVPYHINWRLLRMTG